MTDHATMESRNLARIVIVGASLAGLSAAQTLREEGFAGEITLIGDEPYRPYDRPPLSKSVLTGWLPPDHTALPERCDVHATWKLGVAAVRLDRHTREVHLADGARVPFDRLLIATGTRARPWPNAAEAALDRVFTIRTRDDSARLRARLAASPRRVLVIGGGFTGSEVASVCCELGLAVTLVERSAIPLAGALGQAAGTVAMQLQREHEVDLRVARAGHSGRGDGRGRPAQHNGAVAHRRP